MRKRALPQWFSTPVRSLIVIREKIHRTVPLKYFCVKIMLYTQNRTRKPHSEHSQTSEKPCLVQNIEKEEKKIFIAENDVDLDVIWNMKDHNLTSTWLASNCEAMNHRTELIKNAQKKGLPVVPFLFFYGFNPFPAGYLRRLWRTIAQLWRFRPLQLCSRHYRVRSSKFS